MICIQAGNALRLAARELCGVIIDYHFGLSLRHGEQESCNDNLTFGCQLRFEILSSVLD